MFNYVDTISNAVSKVDDTFFRSRARELITSVCQSSAVMSEVSNVRVAKNWPRKGSITFTRVEDGVKFRAYMTTKKFIVKEVK
jgi:hypothetical protein